MRAVRQKAMLSQRFTKETQSRAKRLTREMQNYWKKFDRVEKQQKRQEEKEAEQQQKMDLQLLEAKRQQRKLNFLITQTELVSFILYIHMSHSISKFNSLTKSNLLSKDIILSLHVLKNINAALLILDSIWTLANFQKKMKHNFFCLIYSMLTS